MRQKFTLITLAAATLLLTACETMTLSREAKLYKAEKWALLPIENFSTTPMAGDNAKALVETHLRSLGVKQLVEYQPAEEQNLLAILDSGVQLQRGRQWAYENGFRYAVTGKVQEWHYKNGLDNEPAVGLSLKVFDLYTDEVIWQGSASRTGWGYSNLSSVASKTVGDLLSEVRLRRGRDKTTGTQVAATPSSREPAAAAALPANKQPAQGQ